MVKSISVFGLIIALASCFSSSEQGGETKITLVFPDNFRGVAIIRANQPNGISVESDGKAITLRFPDTGVIDIKDPLPSMQWHELSAKYVSGKAIPVYEGDDRIADESIALRSVGLLDDKEDWYVVGNLDDARKAFDKKAGLKFRPSSSYSSASPQIIYIFPDGFRGIAKIRARQPGGISVTPLNNSITLNFPSSGVIDIKGDLPTLKWHRTLARYANGDSIIIAGIENQKSITAQTIAFRPAGLVEDKEDWYVIGTYDDLRAAMEKKRDFKQLTR